MQYQRDLLSHVHEVCRLHWRRRGHPDVEIKEEESHGFAYLLVSYNSGPWRKQEVVGVRDGHVDNAVLRDFQLLTDGKPAEFVFRGHASPATFQFARDNGIWLRSIADYQAALWDATPYLRAQNDLLRRDPEYPLSLYVDKSWTPLGDPNPAESTALPQILEWLTADGPRFILVLGDFGTGKTFLLRAVADALADSEYLVPVLVTMRDLEKGRTLDELLAQHMARSREDLFSPSAFRYLLREGRIALLFDGFDELALRTSYERVPQHFATLREAAGGSAKVVVTSRHQYFATDQAVRNALGDEVHRMSGSRIIRLLPLRSAQRRELVARTFDDDPATEGFMDAMRQVPNLLDLATNPRMLAFMIDWYRHGLLTRSDLVQSAGQPMTAGKLYELLLTNWLSHEVRRQAVVGGLVPLSTGQRMDALRETAIRMWRSGQSKLSLTDLGEIPDQIHDLARLELRPGEAVQTVASATVLVRDESGDFSFIHQSVMEWFVADAARDALADGSVDTLLATTDMSGLMVDFWCDLSGSADVIAWARDIIARTHPPGPAAKANAALVLQRRHARSEAMNLTGHDLRGRDLSAQEFIRADLRGADLSGAVLPKNAWRANLADSRLVSARMIDSNLTGAILTSANLTAADLTGARLVGADLTNANLTGTRLRRAVLVGAKVHPTQLASAHTSGAALPETHLVPQFFGASTVTALAGLAGGLLVSGHEDGTVRVHDVSTSRTLRIITAHDGRVTALATTRNGWIASGGDRRVRLWDSTTGDKVAQFPAQLNDIVGIAVEPDGEWVACVDGARIHVWLSAGDSRWTLETSGTVYALAAHPDDGSLFSAGSSVRQWKGRNPVGTWQVPDGVGRITGLLVGSGPGHLWLYGTRGVVQVSDTATEWSKAGEFSSVVGSANSPWLALIGKDTITLHSRKTRQETTIDTRQTTPLCAIDPDGRWLATEYAGRLMPMWRTSDGQQFGTIDTGRSVVTSLTARPGDEFSLVLGKADGGGTWDLATGDLVPTTGVDATSVTIDQTVGRLALGRPDGTLIIDGSPVYSPSYHAVMDLAFEPTGQWLAAATTGAVVMVNTKSGRIVKYGTDRSGFRALAFDFAGRWLASVGTLGEIQLWDAQPRNLNPSGHRLTFPAGCKATAVTALPHRDWLVTGGRGQVQAWHPHTAECVATYEFPGSHVTAFAVSPDSRWFGAGDRLGNIRVWDVDTQEIRYTIRAHADWIAAMFVDPVHGRWFASAGYDGAVHLWDSATGTPRATVLAVNDGWAVLLPDGRYKVSGNPREVWWVSGLCRFDVSDLDDLAPYLPYMRRIPEGEPVDLLG
ncbi:NACHT and WD40 repeat domain-containing protein [Actinocrispum wychmicini]|uniref:Pentapeptide repeat protein n=1 Tax=Actinocrispum wychmicini TaxID=1213861 RepID=A0A4R2JYV1_9PSEU|nr:pentapeptide repeat-containing protein [Actinocrispum wychmicini]TCO62596.1 pentapeptide repeat protein [Actinocrispum wychmicini]